METWSWKTWIVVFWLKKYIYVDICTKVTEFAAGSVPSFSTSAFVFNRSFRIPFFLSSIRALFPIRLGSRYKSCWTFFSPPHQSCLNKKKTNNFWTSSISFIISLSDIRYAFILRMRKCALRVYLWRILIIFKEYLE